MFASPPRLGGVGGGRLNRVKMHHIFNDYGSISNRRKLRKNMPTPEIVLWQKIRNRQINNYKFKRQYGVGRYIVDFYCSEKRLAIEIDGDSHYEDFQIIYDKERTEYLNNMGIVVVRFTNKEIMDNIEGVLDKILEALVTSP